MYMNLLKVINESFLFKYLGDNHVDRKKNCKFQFILHLAKTEI